VLTIPGQVNGPKLANNAITTDPAVSQDLGVIGRDNQNRIRWGNLLTLPVGQGGLLYVEPVYASPGASDAASSYPRLIRVAMMYNDKIGYGPTVGDALNGLFGPGAGATATGIEPTDAGTPPNAHPNVPPPATGPGTPTPPTAAVVPPAPDGSATLSPAKAAAMQEIQAAIGAARDAQKKGDFAAYGAALQRLDDAITKFNATK
jgi:uncharacterized membrane protein (UPF0182 family)